MPFQLFDRVQETTTTTGTGTINLGGAVSGYQAFSAAGFASGDVTYYGITSGTAWEVGIGTLTSGSPWTLARTTVLSSSNSGSAITLAGISTVWCDMPASAYAAGPNSAPYSFRNLLINGGFTVNQYNANAAVAGNPNTDFYPAVSATNWYASSFPCDRWYFGAGTATATAQVTSAAGQVTPSTSCLTVTTTTGGGTTTSVGGVGQTIEGKNLTRLNWDGSGNQRQNLVLSFWVKSSTPGTFSGCLAYAQSGFLADPTQLSGNTIFSYTINSASTWEFKTVLIPRLSAGPTLDYSTDSGLLLWFDLGSGSTYQGSVGSWNQNNAIFASGATSILGTTGRSWSISAVQLEAVSATPFEGRPFGQELTLCQRYYEPLGASLNNDISILGVATAASQFATVIIPYKTTKRTTPSSLWDTTGWTFTNANGPTVLASGKDQVCLSITSVAAGIFKVLNGGGTNPVRILAEL